MKKPSATEVASRLKVLPSCPHLHRATSVCKDASMRLGTIATTHGVQCNVTCARFGPNLGRSIEGDRLTKWITTLFNGHYRRFGSPHMLAKVRSRHNRAMTIVPPKNLDRFREVFSALRARPEVETICATGSIIAKESDKEPRDLDFVVVIADLDKYLDNLDEIRTLIPKEIDGVRTDIFEMVYPSSFFVSVDLWSLVMYQSVLRSEARPGEGISRVEVPDNAGEYDDALERTFARYELTIPRHPLKKGDRQRIVKALKKKRGLGDMVSSAIKVITFGKVKECKGCKKRKRFLNRLGKRIGL